MLIRFAVKNLFSFNEATEFNMLPSKATRLKHHKYKLNDEIDVLKLAAIYGANASGKSNLVKALLYFKLIIMRGEIIRDLNKSKFKFSASNQSLPIDFSIEFKTNENEIYYYALTINDNKIVEEYLSKIITKNKEKLIFHRKQIDNITKVQFFEGFETEERNKLLKELIETSLLNSDLPLLSLLNRILPNYKDNYPNGFDDFEKVLYWFIKTLNVIQPNTKYSQLPVLLEKDPKLKQFAVDILRDSSTGITDLKIETIPIEIFFGQDNTSEIDKIKQDLEKTVQHDYVFRIVNNEMFNFIIEDEKIVVKKLWFVCLDGEQKAVDFQYNELSDGTKRILDYLKLVFDIIYNNSVYMIDEIERSIHPILIKELISKFSQTEDTNGQLIFTSHECNLLDQDILRTDEIWFAEKNKKGETKLYSLSDFKEHSTIDIRKGYLQGRYGGIPFISNLQDLNWHKEDVAEK